MSHKSIVLFALLSIFSICLGAVLGLLDIFGFIDGRHTLSFTLLFVSAGIMYCVLVTLFLLNFSQQARMYSLLIIASALFGTTFYLMSLQIVLTGLVVLAYNIFLIYVHTSSTYRTHLFITFRPREIFFPILKNGFTFFLILTSILAYTQSQRLVTKKSLVSPALVRAVSRPSVFLINQQINSRLTSGTSADVIAKLSDKDRKDAVTRALHESLLASADPETQRIYGIKVAEIPVHKAHVNTNGTVDIAPVVEAMLPTIAYELNAKIDSYALIAPFAVALLAFLLLQPFLLPIQFVESTVTVVLFRILVYFKILSIKTEQRTVEVPYIA